MTENPEYFGMGAIVIALITAWSKIKPALKEIASKDDHSLRGDLLARIKELEANEQSSQDKYEKALKEIRAEYEKKIEHLQNNYEQKLSILQDKVDTLTKAILERKV